MAEGEGFEPPVRFPVQWFSRPPVSTAHASLRFINQQLAFAQLCSTLVPCTTNHSLVLCSHDKHPRSNQAKPAPKAASRANHRKQDCIFHSVLSHNGNGRAETEV